MTGISLKWSCLSLSMNRLSSARASGLGLLIQGDAVDDWHVTTIELFVSEP
jgi:hypothetical protein